MREKADVPVETAEVSPISILPADVTRSARAEDEAQR
jgi:hypothetical protein